VPPFMSPVIQPRRIQSGAFQGLTFDLAFSNNLQGYLGLQERELAPSLRRLTHGIRTAIDVGAADGWYTTYFLTRTSAQQVIAVEPDSSATQHLLANVRRNHGDVTRMELVTACLGSRRPNETDEIRPLDSLCGTIESPVLVKIDVEGAELDVLASGARLLALPDVRLIVEVHSEQLENECVSFLTAHGYHVQLVKNAWWRSLIPETRVLPHNRWLVAQRAVGWL
jgi:hypothetical protein